MLQVAQRLLAFAIGVWLRSDNSALEELQSNDVVTAVGEKVRRMVAAHWYGKLLIERLNMGDAKLLIEANANPNATDENGHSALHLATESGLGCASTETNVVELLVEAGAVFSGQERWTLAGLTQGRFMEQTFWRKRWPWHGVLTNHAFDRVESHCWLAPLCTDDERLLREFYATLGAESRAHYSVTDPAAQAAEACAAIGKYDKLRLVGRVEEGFGGPTTVAAIVEFSMDLVPDTLARFGAAGVTLRPEETCRFGLCVADALQGRGRAQTSVPACSLRGPC